MIDIAADFRAVGVEIGLGWITSEVEVAPASAALKRSSAERLVIVAGQLAGDRPQDVPAVAATRAAYRALGKDPSRYRPSAEALLRRVVKEQPLLSINNVVDVNNVVSLESGLSIGTYDMAKLVPPIVLRRGRAGETYDGIGRGSLNLEGLPVMVDAFGPFGSPTSDSRRSAVDNRTTNIGTVLFGFAPARVEACHLELVQSLLETFCNARITAAKLIDGG